jgi:hypothetical protein
MPTFTGAKAKLICSYMFTEPEKLFVTVLNGKFYMEPESSLFLHDEAVEIESPVISTHAMKRISMSCKLTPHGYKFFEIAMRKIQEEAACRNT